jgi:hypothetical protein
LNHKRFTRFKMFPDGHSEHHWMDKSVAKLNIEHYKRLLASETDATKRESIARLLAEEEAKLAKISKERKRT